jgi:hypothetical protein
MNFLVALKVVHDTLQIAAVFGLVIASTALLITIWY